MSEYCEFSLANAGKLVELIKTDPFQVNKKVKKFLKNLFKTEDEDFTGNEQVYNTVEQFYQLVEKLSARKACRESLHNIFDLIIGHSVIREIFLKQDYRGSAIRTLFIRLFCLISEKCLDHCRECDNFVDFLLGSYDATLSFEGRLSRDVQRLILINFADQSLLRILSLLEANDFNLARYRPFIWGINGAQFYAAKHAQKLAFLKWPTVEEIFKGFSGETLSNSISSFPISLSMTDLPIEVITNVCEANIYDPRFLLPMFYHFLSSESIVKCHKFISYGALSYTIVALSSQCLRTRTVAYRVLSRLYYHLTIVDYPQDRHLWIGLIDLIRGGLSQAEQLLESIHTVFFARMIEILLNPLSPLFPTVRNFLIHTQAKSYNLQNVPFFYEMAIHRLVATNPKTYAFHQRFVINWIKDSLKTTSDVKICHRRRIFSDMLLFYNSPLLASANKPLILNLLTQLATLFEGIKVLCFDCAIISWLKNQLLVMPMLDKQQSAINDSLYNLVVAIWNTAYTAHSDSKQPYIFYQTFSYELIDILNRIIHKTTDQSRLDRFSEICQAALASPLPESDRFAIKLNILTNLPVNSVPMMVLD